MKTVSSLKSEIVAFAAQAQALRVEASALEGVRRSRVNEARTGLLRYNARMALLAYAYLRGIPYACLERKTRQPATPLGIYLALGGTIAKDPQWVVRVAQIKDWLEAAQASSVAA